MNQVVGFYLGCVCCGARFVLEKNELPVTNCCFCFSSVVLLEEIRSQEVLETLQKYGVRNGSS